MLRNLTDTLPSRASTCLLTCRLTVGRCGLELEDEGEMDCEWVVEHAKGYVYSLQGRLSRCLGMGICLFMRSVCGRSGRGFEIMVDVFCSVVYIVLHRLPG